MGWVPSATNQSVACDTNKQCSKVSRTYEKCVTECGGLSAPDEHCGGLFFCFPCAFRDWLLCRNGPETKLGIQRFFHGSWNQQIWPNYSIQHFRLLKFGVCSFRNAGYEDQNCLKPIRNVTPCEVEQKPSVIMIPWYRPAFSVIGFRNTVLHVLTVEIVYVPVFSKRAEIVILGSCGADFLWQMNSYYINPIPTNF